MSQPEAVSPAKPADSNPEAGALQTLPPVPAAALAKLEEMARIQRVSPRYYLEALLHYAISCHERPGSWEGARPFEFRTYDDRNEEGQYADRWFTSDEKAISEAQRAFDSDAAVIKESIADCEAHIAELQSLTPDDEDHARRIKDEIESSSRWLADERECLSKLRIEDYQ